MESEKKSQSVSVSVSVTVTNDQLPDKGQVPVAPEANGFTLPPVADVAAKAWVIFVAHFWKLLVISVLSVLSVWIPILIGGLFAGIFAGTVGSTSLILMTILVFLALLLAGTYLAVWGQVSMLWFIINHGDNPTIKQAYVMSREKIIPYFWVGLLNALVTIAGFLLFLAPGLIFSVWFCLALFILMNEDERGMSALLKSKEYVKGDWWQYFRYIVAIFVMAAFVSIVMGVFENAISENAMNMVGNMVSMVVTPFFMVYTYVVYLAARSRKPGLVLPENKKHRTILAAFALFGALIPIVLIIIGLGSNPTWGP